MGSCGEIPEKVANRLGTIKMSGQRLCRPAPRPHALPAPCSGRRHHVPGDKGPPPLARAPDRLGKVGESDCRRRGPARFPGRRGTSLALRPSRMRGAARCRRANHRNNNILALNGAARARLRTHAQPRTQYRPHARARARTRTFGAAAWSTTSSTPPRSATTPSAWCAHASTRARARTHARALAGTVQLCLPQPDGQRARRGEGGREEGRKEVGIACPRGGGRNPTERELARESESEDKS